MDGLMGGMDGREGREGREGGRDGGEGGMEGRDGWEGRKAPTLAFLCSSYLRVPFSHFFFGRNVCSQGDRTIVTQPHTPPSLTTFLIYSILYYKLIRRLTLCLEKNDVAINLEIARENNRQRQRASVYRLCSANVGLPGTRPLASICALRIPQAHHVITPPTHAIALVQHVASRTACTGYQ